MVDTPTEYSKKNFYLTWVLCAFGGYAGLHFFYLGRYGAGFLRIFLSLILIGFILWLVDVVKIFLGKFEDKDGNKLMNYSQWLAQSSYNKNIISKTGASIKDEEELAKQEEELLKKFNDESDKYDPSEQEEEPLKKSNDKSDEEDLFKNI